MVLGFSHYVIDGLRISVLQPHKRDEWLRWRTHSWDFLRWVEATIERYGKLLTIARNHWVLENVPWIFRAKPNL
jgi:hypothetical protein